MRLWVALLICLPLWAATQVRCVTEDLPANKYRSENDEAFSQWIELKNSTLPLSLYGLSDPRATVYEIPVVVHILHGGEAVGTGKNLSEARIIEQIEVLNQDFRRMNADTVNTPEEFKAVAADTEITFVLARQDPEGQATNGIVRTEVEQAEFDDSDASFLASISRWPAEDYVNIYVANMPDALGFAYFPFSDLEGLASESKNLREVEGVFVDYRYFGINDQQGMAFPSYGRTLTHEMGHYFGLLHIAHGNCATTDFCDDTPVQASQTLGITSCSSIPFNGCNSQVRPMIENYMDYTDDECMNLYTLCQKSRMRTVIENSPRRSSLLLSHGLEVPVIVSNDLGIRELRSPQKSDCVSSFIPALQIKNYGNNEINTFEITTTINGEIQESIPFSNTIAPGLSTVISLPLMTLTTNEPSHLEFEVTSVNGTQDGKAFNNLKSILLSPSESSIAPYTMDFENAEPLYAETEVALTSRWEKVTAPDSVALNQAARLPFFNNQDFYGIKDLLYTNVLDLSSLTSAQLTFKYAYSGRTAGSFLDELIVAVSTDCGMTFPPDQYLFQSRGNSLATTSPTNNAFAPTSINDWRRIDLNITPLLEASGLLQIAFIGINGGGNHLYIDDVSVTSANLPAYDMGIRRSENTSVVTCRDDLAPKLNIRNFGFERINELQISVTLNGATRIDTFTGLNIPSGFSEDFTFTFNDLFPGENNFHFEIMNVNDTTDVNKGNNSFDYTVFIDDSRDTIPIKETFNPGTESQWIITSINDAPQLDILPYSYQNDILKVTAYDTGIVGAESWLVSPNIYTQDFPTGAIRFRYAYRARPGYTDNLRILLSTNCGISYDIEVYNQNSTDLTSSFSQTDWEPSNEEDWITAFVDISDYMIWHNLRFAFVFTNGQGNNLYLDDIELLTSNDTTQRIPPQRALVYPNPAEGRFFISCNLPDKRTLYLRVLDMTGRTVIEHIYPNSLNQKYEILTDGMKGFYVVVVTGEGVRTVKRLYIR